MAEIIIRGPEQNFSKQSFGETIFNGLKNGANNIAMVDVTTNEELTYNEVLQKSISLAQHLQKMNITKNDIISISSENSLHFTITVISALYLGTTVAPLNHFYTEREFIHAMNISKPKIVFCSSTVLNNIIAASKKVKSVKLIIVINKCSNVPDSVLRLEDLIHLQIPDNFYVTPVELDHTAAILCSSGTTGLPKGVMLTHKGLNQTFYFLQHPDHSNYGPPSIGMGLLPYYHAYGLINHLCMLATNVKLVVMPRFEDKLFLKSIEEHKVTIINAVPPIILFLSKSPLVDNYDLSSIKYVYSGAAPLGKDIQDAFSKRLNVNILQGYGLTEFSLAATLQSPKQKFKYGSVGVLLPGTECKVIDLKTGRSLGPNQQGEICLRGSSMMKGYFGNPKATAETIKNGWLHTGDVGYYDNDEYFYIVDRYKELIKYKGFQVPPAELEDLLLKHPKILDCAVIGKPDVKAGELPMAFVVKQPNAKLSEKDVIDYVAGNVSYHKRLHGGVRFIESIPKNLTGKILRRLLRDQLESPSSKL